MFTFRSSKGTVARDQSKAEHPITYNPFLCRSSRRDRRSTSSEEGTVAANDQPNVRSTSKYCRRILETSNFVTTEERQVSARRSLSESIDNPRRAASTNNSTLSGLTRKPLTPG